METSELTDTKRGNRTGRGSDGRFAPGNAGGPGNLYAARVGELRGALLDAVTPEDLRAVVRALVDAAKGGDVTAAKVLFERVLGRPLEADILERLEAVEQAVEQAGGRAGRPC
jgi:hypothetical protein